MLRWESLALLLILLTALYLYFSRQLNYWAKRNVPFKKPTLLFGNLLDIFLKKDYPGKYLGQLYQEFTGPYFGFFALHRPFLVLRDPNIIKRILAKDFAKFPNRLFFSDEKIDPIASSGLFSIKEPHWKPLRSKLSPMFTTGKIKMMLDLMKECGENLQEHIKMNLNKDLEIKSITSKYTIDLIATCVFGVATNSFENENSEFVRAGKDLANRSLLGTIRALCYFFIPSLVRIFKFKFLSSQTVSFLGNVFLETIAVREKGSIKRNDIIDILIELKRQETNPGEFKFDDNRMIAQGIVFFLAGQDSTSSTIAFTLHELCINTDIQDRLRREILEVIEKHDGLTYEALQDMKYLQMVVSETLRKYPLTLFIDRECTEDYIIPETGLLIEKGTPVLISQHGLHWDPNYFPNPQIYDPERFNSENKPKIPACVYLPFGDGPRVCVGERFGLISTKIGIIYILKNFNVKRNLHTQEPLTFKRASFLQAQNGIHLTLENL